MWKQLRILYQIICNHIESKWLTQVNDVDNLHRDGRVPVLHVERWITGQDSAHTETAPRQTRQFQNQQGSGDGQAGGRQVQTNRAVAPGRSQATSAYLKLFVDGEPVQCLIDSGSEASIFPLRCVREEWLRNTRNSLRAANGGGIPVAGEADVPVVLPGGFRSTIKAIVSDHVPEPMLGFDWLRDVDAHLSFGKPALTIQGRRYRLQAKPFSGWVRRVVVQSDVNVPNRCEYDIDAKVEFSKLACRPGERGPLWMTEAKELRPGVYIPRTLVPDRSDEVPVR